MAYNGPLPQVVNAGGTGANTLTNHSVLVGAGTSTIAQAAPSATSGVPLISQGSSSNPTFGTAAIAGGGTNATSFTQTDGIVVYNGTSLVNYTSPTINSSGIYTNTAQPSFFAYLGTTDTNITGAGTGFTIGTGNALTIVTNQGSGLATNGTFTAPVTGIYHFIGTIAFGALSSSHTDGYMFFLINGTAYLLTRMNPYGVSWNGDGSGAMWTGSVIVALASSQTAALRFVVNNGAATVGALGGTLSGNPVCQFSGSKIN